MNRIERRVTGVSPVHLPGRPTDAIDEEGNHDNSD